MSPLELACLGIVTLYIGSARRAGAPWRRLIGDYLSLSVAAWLAETSCIRLYGFYSYDPSWALFADVTPVLILLIWPVVILTARALVKSIPFLERSPSLSTGLVVLADAALIEAVAVAAGLWSWSEPGLFGVPPIGVLGWGLFATVAVRCGLIGASDDDADSGVLDALMGVTAVVALTHLGLLACWWGALRWLNAPLPDSAVAAVAWILSATTTTLVLSRRLRCNGARALLDRLPGALFFFVLLARLEAAPVELAAYAMAFVPPYLALCWQSLAPGARPGPPS